VTYPASKGHPPRPEAPIIRDGVALIYDDNPTDDGIPGDPIVFVALEDLP
jgi:hypothetical protein